MKKRISLIVNVIELYCIARREIKSSPVTEFAVASHLNTANSRVEVGKKTVVLPPKICYDYYVYSGGAKMIKTILTIIFIIICVFLSAVILLQEGKSAGLSVPSAVWLTATGAEIKAVLWKESWRS
jgi:hypothetical protein